MEKYEYIDLGLPSGTLWATMNVGAEGIADYGGYFSHEEALNFGVTLPTKEQFEELVENTTYKWAENYNNCGVNGDLFIGKNGKELFFPASGYYSFTGGHLRGSFGYYWSSSFLEHDDSYAYFLSFTIESIPCIYVNSCSYRFAVRGVINC